MPSTILDTTLAELCSENGITRNLIITTHCVPNHMDLHPEFPRELVYLDDEEPFPYNENVESKEFKARARNIMLGLRPLRRAFCVGPMDVILFTPNIKVDQVEQHLDQLPPYQRYRPQTIDLDKGDVFFNLRETIKDHTLVFWRPQSWMLGHDCLINPQVAYDINSKEFLIKAGMKTPPSIVVDLENIGDDSVFAKQPLPFVVKVLRGAGGFGNYLVTSEDKRGIMLKALARYKGRGVMKVILSKYIRIKLDLSVHFFIGSPESFRNRDNPLILGITVQTLVEDHWVGGHIDYREQKELQNLVWDTLVHTTQRLPEDFAGWAGIDIVIDEDGDESKVVEEIFEEILEETEEVIE